MLITHIYLVQVTWYKDGRELRSNDHVTLQYSHGVCSLEVMSAKPEDTGVYKCYAVNELGEHETSSKVVVEGTQSFLSLRKLSHAIYRDFFQL